MIFINYRRIDSQGSTVRLSQLLKRHFGEQHVFVDVDDMQAGMYAKQISDRVEQSKVFLIVIGKNWLKAKNERTEQRRLDEEEDFVRLEIEMALNNQKLLVLVTVDGAGLPERDMLPKGIQGMLDYQAVALRDDDTKTYESDSEKLIELIKRALDTTDSAEGSLLNQLVRNFVSSKSDLKKYNIARRTLLSYLKGNPLVNGTILRLVEAHIALVAALTLRRLKENWDKSLGGDLRDLAVENVLDYTDPMERSELAEHIIKGLQLDEDEELRDAFEQGLSFTLPLKIAPLPILKLGVPAAFRHTVVVLNALDVLDELLPLRIRDAHEDYLASALEQIGSKLSKEVMLPK